MKLTRRQLLTICDRNVRKRKKKDKRFNEQSYRRGFMAESKKDGRK